MTKDKQWSTKHCTESWRLNNANIAMAIWLKTNNDLQNTAQNPEDWTRRSPLYIRCEHMWYGRISVIMLSAMYKTYCFLYFPQRNYIRQGNDLSIIYHYEILRLPLAHFSFELLKCAFDVLIPSVICFCNIKTNIP